MKSSLLINPGALLARLPADLSLGEVAAELRPYDLRLPIVPLGPDLPLAEAVARNLGGRLRLGFGTLVRYLRGATLAGPQGSVEIGGPTLKRATGYGLHRALIPGGVELGHLESVTLSLRPLPAQRVVLAFVPHDGAEALHLARQLREFADPVALLLQIVGGELTLLAEFEGSAALLERQAAQAAHLSAQVVACDPDGAFAPLQTMALAHATHAEGLDRSLERQALAELIDRAAQLRLHGWFELGLGLCHLHSADQMAFAEFAARADQQGARPISEFGRVPSQPLPKVVALPRTVSSAERLSERLRAVVGPRNLFDRPAELFTYEQDASIAQPSGRPLAAVLPTSSTQVAAVVRLAAEAGVPIVTRGAGSGLAGGSTPSEGALVLGLSRLDQIVVDPHARRAEVGAGAITADLQRAAEAHGLFYPPDPSSQAVSTIGGNLACNAGGPRCLKYGVSADYLLALRAVLADGREVQIGEPNSAQGGDAGLAQLLVGSEGTLAIITAATMRLIRKPVARRTSLAIFPRLDDACATVEAIMAGGVIPAGLELMDAATIAAVEGYLGLGLPHDCEALLLLLADGEPEEVAYEAERLAAFARQGGASSVRTARDDAEEADLWRGRRAVAPALARIRPNRLGEDISVPVDQIAACVRQIAAISAAFGQPIAVFGHAGDGNLHPNILFDSRNPDEVARTWQAAEAIFALALELGGTLSGEHGIGTLKRPFMARALGAAALAAQHQIKAQLDPHNLLNPGKVLPAQ